MKYISILIIFYSCATTNITVDSDINVKRFKDRALCNCIVMGLDKNGNSEVIQKLKPYNPEQFVLFDSSIRQSLIPVIKQMETDSIAYINTICEACQGRPVFKRCIEYYNSKELNTLAHKELKRIKKIDNLTEYISSRFSTW